LGDLRDQERRKDPRYTARNLRIILKDDRNFRGEKIRDISLGGVFVRTEEPYEVGTPVWLTLDPKLGIGEVKLEGVVVWKNTGEGGADRGNGIKFKEMPKRIEEKLQKLFKTLRKIEN
jgi:uncharacterized protein (TIGR02266 family)